MRRRRPLLVNAVIHAYLEEVAGMELKERELRIDQLDRLYCEKEEELRRNHNVLRQLAEQMGTAETAAGFVDQQLALQEAIDARREFSAARGELRRAKAERKAGEALLNNTASTDVPDFEVDALAQNDPLINQVLLPLVADLKKQLLGADAAATQRLTDKLKAVQGGDRHAPRGASAGGGITEAGGHRSRSSGACSARSTPSNNSSSTAEKGSNRWKRRPFGPAEPASTWKWSRAKSGNWKRWSAPSAGSGNN